MSQKGKVKLSFYIFILAVSKRSWGIQLPSVDTCYHKYQRPKNVGYRFLMRANLFLRGLSFCFLLEFTIYATEKTRLKQAVMVRYLHACHLFLT
jgi:hypothetical protein